jgi:hypothetical protein
MAELYEINKRQKDNKGRGGRGQELLVAKTGARWQVSLTWF